jgi:hypothetical protein
MDPHQAFDDDGVVGRSVWSLGTGGSSWRSCQVVQKALKRSLSRRRPW